MSKRDYRNAFGRVGLALGHAALNRYANSGTQTVTHRYAGGGNAGGVRFSRERHRVGRRRRRTGAKLADVLRTCGTYRTRWQLMSNTLTGPGRVPIAFGGYNTTDVERHSMPIHFMSLSQNPWINPNMVVPGKGAYNHGLYRVVRNPGNGTLSYLPFQSNTNIGVNNYDVNGHWQPELLDGNVFVDRVPNQIYHKWTEVKMNLYGAKYIPLTYTINIVQMPKEFDPTQFPPSFPVDGVTPPLDNEPEFSEFTRYMEDISRKLLCNPLNVPGTRPEYKENVKLLKSYKISVAPLSYSNAEAEGSASVKVGNVREFKIFLRHDRWRNYSWAEIEHNVLQDRNFADLGWDVMSNQDPVTDVKWGHRVFMFITCTTGPIRDGQQNDVRSTLPVQLTDIPEDFGTYDIIVRNEFLVPGILN